MFVISATQIKAAPVAVKASAKKVEKKRCANFIRFTFFFGARSAETARASPVVGIHPSVARSLAFPFATETASVVIFDE